MITLLVRVTDPNIVKRRNELQKEGKTDLEIAKSDIAVESPVEI